jgi:pimeloyl-ACP methyl ester carboxylesterase
MVGLAIDSIVDNLYEAKHNNLPCHKADQFREASMQERQNRNQLQWFDQYRASKTVLFWACAGSAVLATVVGFSWGGWVTGGTAREMAEQSAAQGRQEVAALVCVERFMAAPDMAAQLTALKGIDRSYQRDKFVEDGGWAIIPVGSSAEASTPGSSADHRKAAGLCAEELTKREIPAAGEVEQINDQTTVAQ